MMVAGSHSAIYEAYYNVVDPNGFGSVGGMEAARFLKKSGLSDVILSKIWDLSDPGGRGCLDKTGMFVALKLVALVQNGKDLSVSNVHVDVPPPKMGDVPLPKPSKPPPPKNSPLITSLPPSAVDWTIKPNEREKYEKLFDSLQPTNGLIPGNKVKNVLMESKLPFETLGKIWDLADQDKDGMLNRHEFIVAMHLVYKALEKYAIPNTLPPALLEQAKRKKSTPSMTGSLLNKGMDGMKPDVPPAPIAATLPPVTLPPQATPLIPTSAVKPAVVSQSPLTWVVSAEEKAKSDTLFIKSDIDKDGFVSGQEIKDVFLQSGVPQPVLAHIWALCDIKQSGKLNNEQFALAMWLVARCLKGIEPPPALTPEMVPPSFQSVKPVDGIVENNSTKYSNPELEMITKDLEELAREKLALESDIAQKEADLKIKSGEIKSLQSELDTLAATLKQLENQKGEAHKRLSDLKAQKAEVGEELQKVEVEIEEWTAKVDKLRVQAAEQAELVKTQETELNTKKEQLEGLKMEEERLEKQKDESTKQLEGINTSLQNTQLNISQAKALITQLLEQKRQMNDAIAAFNSAIESGDTTHVPDSLLRIKPDFMDPVYTNFGVTESSTKQSGFESDPFSSQNNKTTAGFEDDPFKNDPFKSKDAFSSDPFKAAFSDTNGGFAADPFGGSFTTSTSQNDPFNAFDNSRKNSDTKSAEFEAEKDQFGCDPFAVLHAPTRDSVGATSAPGRPSSPSPALPPKKSKVPPPRPAPPRPSVPPASKKSADSGFGDAFGSGGGGFADFSNFDAKFAEPKSSSFTTTTSKTAQSHPHLDFTDDPFRDYRYDDISNIQFDDDPEPPTSKDESYFSSEDLFGKDKFDPFGLDGRQSVPLPSTDPFVNSGRASAPVTSLSEDQQLAWAARESLKLEADRKKRQMQEDAELALAISLSKVETKNQ
ncbi:unnamed protein product [Acanthoscelides obtectus]|uniref:Epidermal growth factor receptor substrate 15-like 1 n=1 Tax=Acanthoscelides obtectus TaxID=200917 RepID=A0A9P0M007_ACAOB|nr:unnamed protein product [Acanthoscelides obtectus]CAK1663230.1 Epidermal growth factor receptor substrate 15-like 1 [Acanthoscelides obtectus]